MATGKMVPLLRTEYGGNNPTDYMYPSEPTDTSRNVWSECTEDNQPFDRRFLMSSGPFTMEPKEIVKFSLVAVWVPDIEDYPCPDFTRLQIEADLAKACYNKCIATATHSAKAESQKQGVEVFPKPADDYCTFRLSIATREITQIKLYDLTGQLVMSKEDVKQETLHLSTKPFFSGVYFYQVYDSGEEIYTGKLFIQ